MRPSTDEPLDHESFGVPARRVLEYHQPQPSKRSPDQIAMGFARIVAGLVLLPVLIIGVMTVGALIIGFVLRLAM
jgi:hypothetical protein